MRLLNGNFSPEEVTLMAEVLSTALAQLPSSRRTSDQAILFAAEILMRASHGERDPARLVAAATTMSPNATMETDTRGGPD
jgi:hypothetical protein